MEKERKFLDDHIKFGFTSLLSNGVEKPQCGLCSVVLSAELMKSLKLKRHLETKHSQHAKKNVAFFRRHEAGLKRQRLNCTGSFNQSNVATIEASYVVALEIAKQKKTHMYNWRNTFEAVFVENCKISSWRCKCSET